MSHTIKYWLAIIARGRFKVKVIGQGQRSKLVLIVIARMVTRSVEPLSRAVCVVVKSSLRWLLPAESDVACSAWSCRCHVQLQTSSFPHDVVIVSSDERLRNVEFPHPGGGVPCAVADRVPADEQRRRITRARSVGGRVAGLWRTEPGRQARADRPAAARWRRRPPRCDAAARRVRRRTPAGAAARRRCLPPVQPGRDAVVATLDHRVRGWRVRRDGWFVWCGKSQRLRRQL